MKGILRVLANLRKFFDLADLDFGEMGIFWSRTHCFDVLRIVLGFRCLSNTWWPIISSNSPPLVFFALKGKFLWGTKHFFQIYPSFWSTMWNFKYAFLE
jgi:hypothetical protein